MFLPKAHSQTNHFNLALHVLNAPNIKEASTMLRLGQMGIAAGSPCVSQPFRRLLLLAIVFSCCATLANAGVVSIGELTFDANTPTALATFDITNLTGLNAFPPDFPITTQLAITVTSLVANLQGGGTLTISGNDFSVVDPQGDLNCTVSGDAASGGCDFAAYDIVSATLSGTLSPLSGLAGLPPGVSALESAFATTITPNAGCGAGTTLTAGCDFAIINANTGTVPEPATWIPLATLLIGLLAANQWKRKAQAG